jgi:hypothetical protein
MTGVAVLAVSAVAVPTVSHGGTDILHFFVRAAMTNDAGATGSVDAKQNKQGKANNQRLDVKVSGLSTNTDYFLYAILDQDTNDFVQVASFTTDASGGKVVRYQQNGNGKGPGKGKLALPAELNPLSDVREIAVFNSSAEKVLEADLTSPDQLQYLIKRDISTNGVKADLRIKATTSQTQFRLIASGLNATNSYLLALNEEVVQENVTDENGKLVITSLPTNTVDVLDIRSVALWDSSSNVVLSTELP